MRHAILPRMSSYRVMHTEYIHTHVHTLNTIHVHVCTIPCNPHITEYYLLAHSHADKWVVHSLQCPPMHLP